jgi:hypothetical protein
MVDEDQCLDLRVRASVTAALERLAWGCSTTTSDCVASIATGDGGPRSRGSWQPWRGSRE